jgi:CubicO group peptidase (beta-lactamase class C family)
VSPGERAAADPAALRQATQHLRAPGALSVRGREVGVSTHEFGPVRRRGEVTAQTVMYGASLAKQVVGLLLAQQVERGLIDPDEPIGDHLDDLPGWAGPVRVRHLIHHTSGLTDPPDRTSTSTNSDVVAMLRLEDARSEPGSRFEYANVGYILLAQLLERSTGRELAAVAHDELFAPLGMSSSTLGAGSVPTPPGRTAPPATVGDGGLWSTAEDLQRWNDAMDGRSLGDAVHERAEAPGSLDDGSPLEYAWGVRVFVHRGRRAVSHGGAWPTWTAKTLRLPEDGVSVALLSGQVDPVVMTQAALAVADWGRTVGGQR